MLQTSEITVLIEHSDPLVAAGVGALLRRRGDFKVVSRDPDPVLSQASSSQSLSPDVAVADYDSGLRLIASMSACRDRVVILTHCESEAKICHALERGARGYLLLGCSLKDLKEALRSVHLGGIAVGPRVASRIAERMKRQALTQREGDILRELMLGLSNKGIAARLGMAVGTVKSHVKSVLRKLHAASRTQAVAIAQHRGVLQDQRGSLSSA
jgi:DNA-binding NarL/FixJ family response regulator